MTAKRIVAVLAAAALIVAALLIRSGLDDDDSASSGPDATDAPRGGDIVVICSTEFEAFCNQLDDDYHVTVEPAGDTFEDLSSEGATPPDAWITLDPFPAMVDDQRGRNNLQLLAATATTVAVTQPLLAAATGIAGDLKALCGDITWRCLGEHVREPLDGGRLLPGFADPITRASGLLSLANAVSGYFGAPIANSNGWDDSNFLRWISALDGPGAAVAANETPLGKLIIRPSALNVAATTTAEASTSPRRELFETVEVIPAIQSHAVVAMYGSRARGLAAELTPLLVAGGWAAPASSEPSLPAGTFIALRNLWEDYNE